MLYLYVRTRVRTTRKNIITLSQNRLFNIANTYSYAIPMVPWYHGTIWYHASMVAHVYQYGTRVRTSVPLVRTMVHVYWLARVRTPTYQWYTCTYHQLYHGSIPWCLLCWQRPSPLHLSACKIMYKTTWNTQVRISRRNVCTIYGMAIPVVPWYCHHAILPCGNTPTMWYCHMDIAILPYTAQWCTDIYRLTFNDVISA
jgi:hypothetical protein